MKCVVEKIKNLFWREKTDSDESELRFHPLTPIGNIEGFQFRDEDKGKWISKRGFQVYG